MNSDLETAIGCLLLGGTAVLLVVVISVLYTVPIMLLWNWLMPELFGLSTISFWQAMGISFLASFLFKSSSGNSNKSESN